MAGDPEQHLLAQCDHALEAAINHVRDAIRIPGVSKTGSNLDEMARWLGDHLKQVGADVSYHDGQIAPIVEGLVRSPESRGKLLVYTLYDVQPADPEEWSRPPFDADIVPAGGGRHLIGRGAFNSKGPLVAFISVVRMFREHGIPLPVDIHFLIEGEEEIGSPSLRPFLEANADRLRAGCDGVLIPYLGTNSVGQTPIMLGFTGLGMLELSVVGGDWGGPAERDVHALSGGWLKSPAWELAGALATLRDADGSLKIDGLTVPDWWTEDDARLVREAAEVMDADKILRDLGAKRFRFDGDLAVQMTNLLKRPKLNIDGIMAGSPWLPGDAPPTQVPRRACAYLDFRFVPGMDPQVATNELRGHLDRHGYSHVDLTVHSTYPASRCDPTHPVVESLVDACRKHSDDVLLLPIHAGAAPLYMFTDIVGVPYAFGGLGYGGRSHAPDEFLDVDSIGDFMRSMISFLFLFSSRV